MPQSLLSPRPSGLTGAHPTAAPSPGPIRVGSFASPKLQRCRDDDGSVAQHPHGHTALQSHFILALEVNGAAQPGQEHRHFTFLTLLLAAGISVLPLSPDCLVER